MDKIEQLEQLLELTPDDPDVPFLLGRELLAAGRAREAAERLEQAARMNPDLAAIRRFQGEALRDAGDAESARRVWSEGIALAERTGDLQAGKEMRALIRKLDKLTE